MRKHAGDAALRNAMALAFAKATGCRQGSQLWSAKEDTASFERNRAAYQPQGRASRPARTTTYAGMPRGRTVRAGAFSRRNARFLGIQISLYTRYIPFANIRTQTLAQVVAWLRAMALAIRAPRLGWATTAACPTRQRAQVTESRRPTGHASATGAIRPLTARLHVAPARQEEIVNFQTMRLARGTDLRFLMALVCARKDSFRVVATRTSLHAQATG